MKNKKFKDEAEQKTWTVYMHISPSGKRYIGVTSKKKVTERWVNGKGYERCPYFYKAIQKYGWENIQHEILCEGISGEKASQMEVDLIRVYKSNNPKYGYNIANGGFTKGTYTVCEETRKKIGDKNRGKKASEKTKELMRMNRKDINAHGWGHSPSSQSRKIVSDKIKGLKRSKESKEKMAKQKEKKIYQYDLNGVLIKEWKSAQEIKNILNYNYGNIGAVCHFRALTSMNYFWSFEKINSPELIKKYLNKEIIIPVLTGGKTKKVIQCDLNNNELKIFNSLEEASKETGITSQQIGYCCRNNTVSGMYRWKYCNDIPYYGNSYFLYWTNHQELLNK